MTGWLGPEPAERASRVARLTGPSEARRAGGRADGVSLGLPAPRPLSPLAWECQSDLDDDEELSPDSGNFEENLGAILDLVPDDLDGAIEEPDGTPCDEDGSSE